MKVIKNTKFNRGVGVVVRYSALTLVLLIALSILPTLPTTVEAQSPLEVTFVQLYTVSYSKTPRLTGWGVADKGNYLGFRVDIGDFPYYQYLTTVIENKTYTKYLEVLSDWRRLGGIVLLKDSDYLGYVFAYFDIYYYKYVVDFYDYTFSTTTATFMTDTAPIEGDLTGIGYDYMAICPPRDGAAPLLFYLIWYNNGVTFKRIEVDLGVIPVPDVSFYQGGRAIVLGMYRSNALVVIQVSGDKRYLYWGIVNLTTPPSRITLYNYIDVGDGQLLYGWGGVSTYVFGYLKNSNITLYQVDSSGELRVLSVVELPQTVSYSRTWLGFIVPTPAGDPWLAVWGTPQLHIYDFTTGQLYTYDFIIPTATIGTYYYIGDFRVPAMINLGGGTWGVGYVSISAEVPETPGEEVPENCILDRVINPEDVQAYWEKGYVITHPLNTLRVERNSSDIYGEIWLQYTVGGWATVYITETSPLVTEVLISGDIYNYTKVKLWFRSRSEAKVLLCVYTEVPPPTSTYTVAPPETQPPVEAWSPPCPIGNISSLTDWFSYMGCLLQTIVSYVGYGFTIFFTGLAYMVNVFPVLLLIFTIAFISVLAEAPDKAPAVINSMVELGRKIIEVFLKIVHAIIEILPI